MQGFVYILADDSNRFYVGSCKNVAERYKRHASGYVHTTRRMKNPRLVFSQEFSTIEKARELETKLKRMKRKDYLEKIIKDGFIKAK